MTQSINSIRTFAYIHDDLPAFHAGYLVITILVASMLNLGAFVLLVLFHMILDIVKYRQYHGFSWLKTVDSTFRESLLDITLLFVGLIFALYLHNDIGIASVSGFVRSDLSIIRAIVTFIPKVKILNTFLNIITNFHHYLVHMHARINKGWRLRDKIYCAVIFVSILLLVFAPIIMKVDLPIVRILLLNELLPWKI